MFVTWNRYVCIHNLYQVEQLFFHGTTTKKMCFGREGFETQLMISKKQTSALLTKP